MRLAAHFCAAEIKEVIIQSSGLLKMPLFFFNYIYIHFLFDLRDVDLFSFLPGAPFMWSEGALLPPTPN